MAQARPERLSEPGELGATRRVEPGEQIGQWPESGVAERGEEVRRIPESRQPVRRGR